MNWCFLIEQFEKYRGISLCSKISVTYTFVIVFDISSLKIIPLPLPFLQKRYYQEDGKVKACLEQGGDNYRIRRDKVETWEGRHRGIWEKQL